MKWNTSNNKLWKREDELYFITKGKSIKNGKVFYNLYLNLNGQRYMEGQYSTLSDAKSAARRK